MVNVLNYTWAFVDVNIRQYSAPLKWFVSSCFLVATIVMISPVVAAESPFPWLLFLIGNIVWMIDSALHKQYPWFWASIIFSVYDVLLVYSRITGTDTLYWANPLIKCVEYFLL